MPVGGYIHDFPYRRHHAHTIAGRSCFRNTTQSEKQGRKNEKPVIFGVLSEGILWKLEDWVPKMKNLTTDHTGFRETGTRCQALPTSAPIIDPQAAYWRHCTGTHPNYGVGVRRRSQNQAYPSCHTPVLRTGPAKPCADTGTEAHSQSIRSGVAVESKPPIRGLPPNRGL
jgi:hypothetical protein